jgi:hypothetical protein
MNLSEEAARKIIETETMTQEAKPWKAWGLYKDHKKALETLIANESSKPKVFGVREWRTEHGKWESERDRLLESLNSALESLGVKHTADRANIDKAHKEAMTKHERFKQYAAAIIREDDMKRESEELARREAEEAKSRIQKKTTGVPAPQYRNSPPNSARKRPSSRTLKMGEITAGLSWEQSKITAITTPLT